MNEALFSLLRFGLKLESPDNESVSCLSTMDKIDWMQLRDISECQGVSAIVFEGLNIIISQLGKTSIAASSDFNWWQNFIFEWIGIVTQIEQGNKSQKRVMDDLASKWKQKGCNVMVMKGQANSLMYPKPEQRSPGDIDCYLFDNYKKGNEIARLAGAEVDESWYKHSVISYEGEIFENHQYFVHTRNGRRGKMLEKDLEDALNVPMIKFPKLTDYTIVPPSQWTAMFLTHHACGHFLSEGLRLKQVLDWAMFINIHQNEVEWPLYYEFCERNHLRKFADMLTSICVNHLGVQLKNPDITTDHSYVEKTLKSIFYDDDYIYSKGEGRWKERLHVIRNLFKYRWKYEELYEQSIWKQMWYYSIGLIFKTEN